MFLIILLFCSINTTPLNLFTRLDINNVTAHIITGIYSQNIFGGPQLSTYVIDPIKMGIVLDLGIFGKFVILKNSSFVVNLVFAPGVCFKVENWNYSQQVNGWSGAGSMPQSTDPGNSRYFGLVHDVGGCAHDLALSVLVLNDIILELGFDQRVPFKQGNTTTCFLTKGVIKYDRDTYDTTSDRDPFFVLPTSCSSPVNYCNQTYFVNNPCAIPQ